MATIVRSQPVYFGNTDCAEPLLRGGPEEPYIKETASQTYTKGDLVYLAASAGTVSICTTTSTKLNSAIAGQAMLAATGTTGSQTRLRVIRPNDLYLMNVYHSTLGSAVTNQNNLGVSYGIILISSKWLVDIENTTIEDSSTALGKVQVVGFPSLGPDGTVSTIGDTYGWVIVKFQTFTIETDGGGLVRNLQLGG